MRIGIIGGGQLARMLALAGKPLGFQFSFYEPRDEHCVDQLGLISRNAYDDLNALTAFANDVDVITYENENIPVQSILSLESSYTVYPSSRALRITQDRLYEKQLFESLAIPTTRYMDIQTKDDLTQASHLLGFPFVLKTRRGGYDGKGQWIIRSNDDITSLPNLTSLDGYLAEEFVDFEREVSIIGVRSPHGDTKFYPLSNNIHQDGILISTHVNTLDPLFDSAKKALHQVLNELNYVGVLTIEFFVRHNTLFANELAPRVHNTGHWTIEGTSCSQFENHLRAICDLPLGETQSLFKNIHMTNIIGSWPDRKTLLETKNLRLHDYEKKERPQRKLGHYTVIQ